MNKIKAIRSQEDYQVALQTLRSLIGQNPVPNTDEADQLEVLSVLIDKYENEAFPSELPSAIEAIEFCMEQKDLKPIDLVPYIGSKSRVSEILSGKRSLTVDMIRALEEGLGIPSKILLRKPIDNTESVFQNWDKKLLNEMKKRSYFGSEVNYLQDFSSVLRDFFSGVISPSEVPLLLRQSNYRSAPTTDKLALTAWSVKVLREARKVMPDSAYKKGSITLDFLREITQLSTLSNGPLIAQKELEKIGIILVIEPHLPKTRLDGAVLMLDNKIPVIGLTLRQDRVDNFWFTLMHELAHVSLHVDGKGTNIFFDELDKVKGLEVNDIEKEADNMASEALIPNEKWVISPARLIPSPLAAKSLANEVGVDVSIVAGKIRYESGNWTYLNNFISDRKVSDLFNNN